MRSALEVLREERGVTSERDTCALLANPPKRIGHKRTVASQTLALRDSNCPIAAKRELSNQTRSGRRHSELFDQPSVRCLPADLGTVFKGSQR